MELTRDVLVDADPDTVRRLLTDGARLVDWLGGELDAEPRPGAAGRYRDESGRAHRIVFRRAGRGADLHWTWWPEDDPEAASTVTIGVEQEGGGTRVRVHERLGAGVEASVRKARVGHWADRLEGLALRAAGVWA